MRTTGLVVAALFVGAIAGGWYRGGEVDALHERIAKLERAAIATRSGFAPLTQIASLLSSRTSQARPVAPAAKPASAKTEDDDFGEDTSDEGEADGGIPPALVTAALGAYSRHSLDALDQDARINSDQHEVLQRAADDMNRHLSTVLDRLLALDGKGTIKQHLDLAVDGLGALKDADDKFRASLTPDQVAAVDRDGFDMLSEIDPALVVRVLTAHANN